MTKDSNTRLVYSTEIGRIKEAPQKDESIPKGDGIVRIARQTSGRKGKGVSLISGFELPQDEIIKIATDLKKKLGCGGAFKNGVIEIQAENREKIKELLEAKGFKVKIAGG